MPMQATVSPDDLMQSVTTRSDMTVKVVDAMGDDERIVQAARVSVVGFESVYEKRDEEGIDGLIRYLMRHRHGSPFEHGVMTFYVEAPIFVFRELMRHRIASYNETSARYRDLEPVFYMPADDRALMEPPSKARPVLGEGTPADRYAMVASTLWAYAGAWAAYTEMRQRGIASEVARQVLPVGIYSSAYVTINTRSLMNLLSLRVHDPGATFVSYPQHEIQMVAEQMEEHFARRFPITHRHFVAGGRVAP